MRKPTLLINVALACVVVGCGDVDQQPPIEPAPHFESGIKVIEYNGHSYIYYGEVHTGGGLTHSASCPAQHVRTNE